MTYSELLRDPRWQKKRLHIFERDGWACTRCRDTVSPLNVHHKYYLPNTEPWDYPDDALTTHCDLCHDKVEFLKWFRKSALHILAATFDPMDISNIYSTVCRTLMNNQHNDSARKYMANVRSLVLQ